MHSVINFATRSIRWCNVVRATKIKIARPQTKRKDAQLFTIIANINVRSVRFLDLIFLVRFDVRQEERDVRKQSLPCFETANTSRSRLQLTVCRNLSSVSDRFNNNNNNNNNNNSNNNNKRKKLNNNRIKEKNVLLIY